MSKKAPHILLVSGWQTINIGDVAHTAGILTLIERFMPEARVTVWPYKPLTAEFESTLRERFPQVGLLPVTPNPLEDELDPLVLSAFEEADFLLHNSGPATLGWRHCESFARHTGKRFGIYGVSYGLYGIPERETLSRARFVFFRDSPSFEAARADGIAPDAIGLALDSAFATDLSDEESASTFLQNADLESGRFLCCVARLRNTPTWEHSRFQGLVDRAKYEANLLSSDLLTAPIRDSVIEVVRSTDLKILLCPEDETQIRITREYIFDRLPDDVKPRVVWRRTFWQPGEAISVYRRSAGWFGSEMHSPIFCIGHGIPAMVARWIEQSTKGLMWQDIGLGDWLFDFDVSESRAHFQDAVLALASNLQAARAKAHQARDRVENSQERSMSTVRTMISDAPRAVPLFTH